MIDICQWRASIGLWCLRQMPYNKETNSCNGRKESLHSRTSSARYHGCNMVLSIVVFLSFLLILSGDVELNPGPRTGNYYLILIFNVICGSECNALFTNNKLFNTGLVLLEVVL